MARDDSWYEIVEGQELEQGDFIGYCPIYIPRYNSDVIDNSKQDYQITMQEARYNIVVMNHHVILGMGK